MVLGSGLGGEDRLKTEVEAREEDRLAAEEELLMGLGSGPGKRPLGMRLTFAANTVQKPERRKSLLSPGSGLKKRPSLEAGASFESKHGAEKEEIIVGSWFWAEEEYRH